MYVRWHAQSAITHPVQDQGLQKCDLLVTQISDTCITSSSLCVQPGNCAVDTSATMEECAIMGPVSVHIHSLAQVAANTHVSIITSHVTQQS